MTCQLAALLIGPIIAAGLGLASLANPEPTAFTAPALDAAAAQCAAGGCASLAQVKAWVVEHGAAAREAGLPMLDCTVGDVRTHCLFDAYALSVETGIPAEYRLDGAVYSDIADAGRALTRGMDGFLIQITSVSSAAPEGMAKGSAGYRVGTTTYDCPIEATAAADRAIKAAAAVTHTLTVDGQECCCDRMAEAMSAKSGAPVIHTVAGLSVACEIQAGIVESIARIEAALEQVQIARDG